MILKFLFPTVRAASMYWDFFKESARLLTSRAYIGKLMMTSTMITFRVLGPSTAAMAMARMMVGNA